MPQQVRAVLRNRFVLTNVAAQQVLTVPLASRIDISRYTNVVLSVNAYSLDIGAGTKIEILAVADMSSDWAVVQGNTPLATVTIDENTSSNSVLVDGLAGDLPAKIGIFVQATQAANPLTIEAEFEVDVVMREQ